MRQLLRKEPIVWNGVNHVIRLGDATDISCVLQKIENPSVGFFLKLLLPFIRVFFVSLFRSSIVRGSVLVCKYNLSKCCD